MVFETMLKYLGLPPWTVRNFYQQWMVKVILTLFFDSRVVSYDILEAVLGLIFSLEPNSRLWPLHRVAKSGIQPWADFSITVNDIIREQTADIFLPMFGRHLMILMLFFSG